MRVSPTDSKFKLFACRGKNEMFNPYAQGGWTNSANPNASSSGNIPPQPSLFGALPYPSQASPPTFITFTFTSFNPTILTSIVTGPQSRTYFTVQTDSPTVGFTVLHNAGNQPMVIIEWLKHPVIEIRDIISKRPTSQFLALSSDSRHRTMTARGKTFVWAPDGNCICLYGPGLGVPQIFARVSRLEDSVVLEMTTEAIQIGLLEACATAALLLQSGRNID
ncbi:hypothetical protein B0H10DRAFT_507207 [Mycena sp. CBHHK59/15]|nr:hypothetical protein B0H10DRAFT_507207 [Mycena sp. CBHHK59/15]